MTNLVERVSNQILLLAPNLLGESLAKQLSIAEPDLEVFLKRDQLTRHPSIVIWAKENLELQSAIQLEVRRLQEFWKPAPLLLLLPSRVKLKTIDFLQFDCPGLLQDPDLETLRESIKILKGGGRVVRIRDQEASDIPSDQMTMGLGQWLLLSGVQQINHELQKLDLLLTPPPKSSFQELLLLGRKRELLTAKKLIYWIWGPLKISLDPREPKDDQFPISQLGISSIGFPLQEEYGFNISLQKRDSIAVWDAIKNRLEKTIQEEMINSTATLLAIEGLSPSRQKGLLIALLEQLDQVFKRLRSNASNNNIYKENWLGLQPELRKQALRAMTGSYVRLPLNGQLTTVGEQLLVMTELLDNDDELPNAEQMLDPLLINKPLIVEGQLLPADDPRALMQLEMFFSNWLIRSAELISAEVIAACSQWPELRSYLLKPHLISTRELERLRNQLNSQNRWQNLIQRPIQLYESKRLFYRFRKGHIDVVLMTEPRDEELRQLGWWQQQVALLVEARDAIAPQIQALVKKLGDLMVVVLTQVIGRAIGLIGRGIAQGMGRSMGRS